MINKELELIKKIRNELQRLELVKKKIALNFANGSLFNGPFGKSNQTVYERKMNDIESFIQCMKATMDDVEKIVTQESKLRCSRITTKT